MPWNCNTGRYSALDKNVSVGVRCNPAMCQVQSSLTARFHQAECPGQPWHRPAEGAEHRAGRLQDVARRPKHALVDHEAPIALVPAAQQAPGWAGSQTVLAGRVSKFCLATQACMLPGPGQLPEPGHAGRGPRQRSPRQHGRQAGGVVMNHDKLVHVQEACGQGRAAVSPAVGLAANGKQVACSFVQ